MLLEESHLRERASFIEQDIFKTDLSKATVVTMYLLPQYNLVLKPSLLALKPGTRIVSHDYGIDDWEPDAKEKIAVPEKKVGVACAPRGRRHPPPAPGRRRAGDGPNSRREKESFPLALRGGRVAPRGRHQGDACLITGRNRL